jgi:hypothetical protein
LHAALSNEGDGMVRIGVVVAVLLFAASRPATAESPVGGGRPFPPREGTPEGTPPSIAANNTSHPTAGIGAWTDPEIARAITLGTSRHGRALKPPMVSAFTQG